MKIDHIAIWTTDLERLRMFYEKYFGCTSNARYVNAAKQFESYFLFFPTGARLELMASPKVQRTRIEETSQPGGYAHLAISLGSREEVDALTAKFKEDGYSILDGPRATGDGYYESVVLDPDGNRIELTM